MSNIIQIKRGIGKPDGKLAPYELGIDTEEYELFVGGLLVDEDGIQKYGAARGIKVSTAATADTAATASGLDDTGIAQVKGIKITKATNATNAEKANQLTNAQNIQINLASTSAVSFDGTAAVSPGVTGILPIDNGGTGLTSNPSILIDLSSNDAANVLATSPRPGITGTLSIKNGGTGLTASPSMLVNLGSTTATKILTASPRPGITGTLPIGNGGTGATTEKGARNSLGFLTQLWKNDDPEAEGGFGPDSDSFSETPVPNIGNYKGIFIVYRLRRTLTTKVTQFVPLGIGGTGTSSNTIENAIITYGFVNPTSGSSYLARRYCYATSTGVVFGRGGKKQSITDTTWDVDNNYMIPEYIYGIA